MEDLYVKTISDMGVSLAELAVKGTASAVNKKIKAAKEIKEIEKLRTTYDELINEILNEREEAVRLAQAYKNELDRLVISDDDIQHLHSTISKLIDLLKVFSPGVSVGEFEVFKDLISVDTLKTMQLLGFNYKAAIGEPLTEICANAISSLGNKSNSKGSNKKK